MTRVAKAIAIAVCLASQPAHAHVEPAVDANNRYVRIAPMRDRIRLAYTVYIGQVPGAQARRRMDANRDSKLDDAESAVYVNELAEALRQGLDITIDGRSWQPIWTETHIGLGTPVTNAGAFSIDLIGWICAGEGLAHDLVMFDRYRMPQPGETELRVQASPGVTVTRSTQGRDGKLSALTIEWRKDAAPLETLGYYMSYTVDPDVAEAVPGDVCAATAAAGPTMSRESGSRIGLLIALAAALALAIAGLALVRRARTRTDS